MYSLNEFLGGVISTLRTFRLRDLIDILVITFAFYQLFLFARKSRAGQLVRGLVFMLVCFALAYLLELRTVRWLLNNFLQVAFIAAPTGQASFSVSAVRTHRCALSGRAPSSRSAMRPSSSRIPTPAR